MKNTTLIHRGLIRRKVIKQVKHFRKRKHKNWNQATNVMFRNGFKHFREGNLLGAELIWSVASRMGQKESATCLKLLHKYH